MMPLLAELTGGSVPAHSRGACVLVFLLFVLTMCQTQSLVLTHLIQSSLGTQDRFAVTLII